MIKKMFLSLLISFCILNIICFFTYNIPERVKDESGSVEYKWPAKSFYSKCNEGFSFGFINNDGFNNSFDYSSEQQIDILFMGSSHIEGFNIPNNKNVTELLNNETEYTVYNIGVSEHNLPICIGNMENAIKKYQPSKYIIIDSQQISFSEDGISQAFNENLPIYSDGIMSLLQKFKYLKLIRAQMANTNQTNWLSYSNNEKAVDNMLRKAGELCEQNGVKLIIVFHPHFTINNDMSATFLYNDDHYNSFKLSAEKYGIEIINMEDIFLTNYTKHNIIPYGFYNTSIGEGHLNVSGHRMIASEIEKVIEE